MACRFHTFIITATTITITFALIITLFITLIIAITILIITMITISTIITIAYCCYYDKGGGQGCGHLVLLGNMEELYGGSVVLGRVEFHNGRLRRYS